MHRLSLITAFATFAMLAQTASAQVTVLSNSPSGDSFTNAGGTNAGQAVGATNWRYNNVRSNGVVGINTTFPRSGTGSAFLSTDGGSNSKADIDYWKSPAVNGAGNAGLGNTSQPLGSLKDLTSLSYDWLRASGAADPNLHPSLRLYVTNSSFTQFGYLVYERVYNGFGAAPVGTWQSDDVFGSNAFMWSTGSLPGAFSNYTTSLSDWASSSESYIVWAVSSGVGSGWGSFTGAVDNIRFGFNGSNTTYNFEAVPEPGTMAALGLGALAMVRRRRKS